MAGRGRVQRCLVCDSIALHSSAPALNTWENKTPAAQHPPGAGQTRLHCSIKLVKSNKIPDLHSILFIPWCSITILLLSSQRLDQHIFKLVSGAGLWFLRTHFNLSQENNVTILNGQCETCARHPAALHSWSVGCWWTVII